MSGLSLFLLAFVGIGVLLVILTTVLIAIIRFYRKVDQGKALIINKMSAEPEVTFTGGVVYPIIHRAEVMDISVKSIVIGRSGKEGLICQDNIRADIKVAFFVRVNKTKEDVLKVAQAIGCERASKQETLEELFTAKFSEALKTVGKQLDFEDLYTRRDEFKDRIIEVIGRDLNGYALEDAAIDYLEQTPIEALDKDNILDARGIRKITAITAEQNMKTNDLRQNERKEITRQDLEADEAILELERRRADAGAKQRREIATVVAREEAETQKIQAEERQRWESARIKADEEIAIQELGMSRQIETAQKDKERVLAIKSEQVLRDRDLEVIARNREVERQEIDKEMELEVKRKEIADVVRGRIVVDKNVAEEEERIKDLRALAEANRHKDVLIVAAKGEAEEAMVKAVRQAEAAEKAAEFQARQKLTMANADLESADRVAKAKIRVAEGVQAERAAEGLALVKVKEANSVAIEKEGMAQARVDEEQGMARVRVRNQDLEAEARSGEISASVHRQKLEADATGKLAEARAIEARGSAEAKGVEDRMRAEAAGLQAKLEAMQKMEGAARDHEEFRLRLDNEQKIRLATLQAQQQMAQSQAHVLAEAFGKADIKIVGGDGEFLDKFVKAASVGNMIDGFLSSSSVAQGLVAPYLSGEKSVGDTVRDVVEAVRPTNGRAHLETMVDAAVGEDERKKLETLLIQAKQLGQ